MLAPALRIDTRVLLHRALSCGLPVALVLAAIICTCASARANVRLPSLLSDNMVVQQGVTLRFWGWADPNEHISISAQGTSAELDANADGRWDTRIGPFRTGGPYEIVIAGKNRLVIHNVLAGEVWVGSGQSNMEWPLQNAANGADEIKRAQHPELRLFTVKRATSLTELDDVEGKWVVCSPETVATFSAVAYFFGLELNQKLKVPVGLIHSSWGGTVAEAWTSRRTLTANPQLSSFIAALDKAKQNLPTTMPEFDAAYAKWEKANLLQDEGNSGLALGYADAATDTSAWKQMRVPGDWEATGLNVDGAIWFRRTVEIPAALAGKDVLLSLGPIDDVDITYFNGKQVGAVGSQVRNHWLAQRRYTVPGALVHAGANTIAVRVFDSGGGGGIDGSAADLWITGPTGTSIPLAGDWLYKEERVVPARTVDFASAPTAPTGAGSQNSPTVLYNAMIAPLTRYSVRGFIWYQGESNVGRAQQYRALFPAMIDNWRSVWGRRDMPFLFVQLANYLSRPAEPSDSSWAELREAQLSTLQVPDTGMAVIIDIGDPGNIHPRNKADVGHRLALWALANTYAVQTECSGPLFQSLSSVGSKLRLKFTHGGGLRTMDGSPVRGFAIAGADGKFVWADATIEDQEIVVWNKSVAQPVSVRYGWADNPEANLYNAAGLPASPFRAGPDAPR